MGVICSHNWNAEGYPKGYPELAAFMESDPGFGILRRFNHLHLRNLLYMQEELTSMDRRLYEIDASETDELNNMTRPGDENVERKVLMTEIRVKLREYGTVLPRWTILLRSWSDNTNSGTKPQMICLLHTILYLISNPPRREIYRISVDGFMLWIHLSRRRLARSRIPRISAPWALKSQILPSKKLYSKG